MLAASTVDAALIQSVPPSVSVSTLRAALSAAILPNSSV
jgi:hypothetical protein